MGEITVLELRKKLEHDLEISRERVRILEEQIKWFDQAMSSAAPKETIHGQDETKLEETEEQSLLIEVALQDKDNPGSAIRGLMETAPGHFNVPGIARAAAKQFPELSYEVLSKRASQIASRLSKGKKIKIVQKGSGRKPNTYISTVLESI